MASRTRLETLRENSTVRFLMSASKTLVTGLELVIVPEDKRNTLEQTKSKEEKWIALDHNNTMYL